MQLQTTAGDAGTRLDHFLHHRLPQYSRSRLQEWIRSGRVLLNGETVRPSFTLRGGECVEVSPAEPAPLRAFPENIPLDILFEDDAVVAVNKPAGMVVHAGAGVHSGTLTNALVYRFGALSQTGGHQRPGIVHRLDRYTSGVILIARSDAAHQALAQQFSSRTVEKAYLTLVHGDLPGETGRIAAPIARDPVRRTRMTARLPGGRKALSTYRVLQRFSGYTYAEVKIATGRTHQIRVHMASIGHPVAGDTLYGARADEHGRYFLHSSRITFVSPATGEDVTVTAPLPPELEAWLTSLRQTADGETPRPV